MSVRIIHGDCRDVLRTMPDESVHCVVTSPPYFGLRDYGVDGQIGLEATPDDFVAEMVAVFRDVRRVLRDDGTLWLNLGDSYAGSGRGICDTKTDNLGQTGSRDFHDAMVDAGAIGRAWTKPPLGLKCKDLIGIPWRVAFALQVDGWYLRQDIIWSKPNPMPESVRDRCTKSHEYLFLLSKSELYHFDQDAILEPCSPSTHARLAQDVQAQIGSERAHAGGKTNGNMKAVARGPGNVRPSKGQKAYEEGDEKHRTKAGLLGYAERVRDVGVGAARRQRKVVPNGLGMIKNNESFDAAMAIMPAKRNKRSVWTVASKPFKESHFATFPPALIEPCIKAGCPNGGTVLDPFGGAGTTGLVADRLHRNAILIEINHEYAEMARRRIACDASLLTEIV